VGVRPVSTRAVRASGPKCLLECRGIEYRYPDGQGVFKALDLRVDAGERVAIIGPNGAGKTTLFHLISGLLAPRNGSVEIEGQPLRSGSFHSGIGMIFQDPDDQLFCPSVFDDVAFGPQNMGLSPGDVTERVQEALSTVGVTSLAERPVQHLSGGEKRLVAIAGVLAMTPRLMLLDEPSAGLDIRNRRRLLGLLQGMRQTLLIASHDLEFLLESCTRVVMLDAGRIVADGPIREVMADADLMLAHGQEKPHSLIPHAVHHQHEL
jgi:cobalt/nickel transport system ATP-binding protein